MDAATLAMIEMLRGKHVDSTGKDDPDSGGSEPVQGSHGETDTRSGGLDGSPSGHGSNPEEAGVDVHDGQGSDAGGDEEDSSVRTVSSATVSDDDPALESEGDPTEQEISPQSFDGEWEAPVPGGVHNPYLYDPKRDDPEEYIERVRRLQSMARGVPSGSPVVQQEQGVVSGLQSGLGPSGNPDDEGAGARGDTEDLAPPSSEQRDRLYDELRGRLEANRVEKMEVFSFEGGGKALPEADVQRITVGKHPTSLVRNYYPQDLIEKPGLLSPEEYEDEFDISLIEDQLKHMVEVAIRGGTLTATLESIAKRMGGKKRLKAWLVSRFPRDIVCYCEPFTGSGQVLLAKPWRDRIEIINDLDADLIHFFRYVRHDPDRLADLINATPMHEAVMYGFRYDLADRTLTGIQRAAAFWFSMQTTFNAVTGKHHMYSDSPSTKMSIKAKKEDFRKMANRLEGVSIRSTTVWRILTQINKTVKGKSDTWSAVFFYLDPPYDDTFGYQAHAGSSGFGRTEQKMLAEWCVKIHQAGNRFIQTNSATDFIKELYGGYKKEDGSPMFYLLDKDVYYSVGRKDRGEAKEAIISNYPLMVAPEPQARMF